MRTLYTAPLRHSRRTATHKLCIMECIESCIKPAQVSAPFSKWSPEIFGRSASRARSGCFGSPAVLKDGHTQTKSLSTCYVRRSEEHTSELQSRENLVCRLLLERKNQRRS